MIWIICLKDTLNDDGSIYITMEFEIRNSDSQIRGCIFGSDYSVQIFRNNCRLPDNCRIKFQTVMF